MMSLFLIIISTLYLGWRVYYLELRKKEQKSKGKLEKNKAIESKIGKNLRNKDRKKNYLQKSE